MAKASWQLQCFVEKIVDSNELMQQCGVSTETAYMLVVSAIRPPPCETLQIYLLNLTTVYKLSDGGLCWNDADSQFSRMLK